MNPEDIAIRRLKESNFNVDPEVIDELWQCFQHLRDMERKINATSLQRLYEGQWAILSLIARGYQLSLCCTEMLAEGNRNGFYSSARSLLEAVCASAWALQNVERLPSLVRQERVKLGKMLNVGYSKWPYLKELYSELSAIVHPARDGHLLGFNHYEPEVSGIMTSFSMTFSDHFFNQKLDTLRLLLSRFVAEIQELVSLKEDSVRIGKVMAEIQPRGER